MEFVFDQTCQVYANVRDYFFFLEFEIGVGKECMTCQIITNVR